MAHEVGDKVIVRSDLKFYQKYGGDVFVRGMEVMLGKEAHIASARYTLGGIIYTISEYGANWTDEMFEDEVDEPISLDVSSIL